MAYFCHILDVMGRFSHYITNITEVIMYQIIYIVYPADLFCIALFILTPSIDRINRKGRCIYGISL